MDAIGRGRAVKRNPARPDDVPPPPPPIFPSVVARVAVAIVSPPRSAHPRAAPGANG